MHTVIGTAANVNDVTQAAGLLHGDETDAWGDAGYQSVGKREELQGSTTRWHVAMRPGKRKALDPERELHQLLERVEQLKASVRAKVEHPFRVVKQQFGYAIVFDTAALENALRSEAERHHHMHVQMGQACLWPSDVADTVSQKPATTSGATSSA